MNIHRNDERGNLIVIAVMVLGSMVGVAGIAALNVQANIASAGNDRNKYVALYAAESGAALTMQLLRGQYNQTTKWTEWIEPGSTVLTNAMATYGGNNPVAPSDSLTFTPSNFLIAPAAGFGVEVVNNTSDPKFSSGIDSDGRVLIRSTGYGPNGTIAQVEMEVGNPTGIAITPECTSYAQKNMSELGSGGNSCLGTVTLGSGAIATITPGGP